MKTLNALLEEYLESCLALNFSKTTIKTCRNNNRLFLRWLLDKYGICRAEELRSSHLEEYQSHLARKRTAAGLNLKPRSINKRVENMKVFMGYLARGNYVSVRLADAIQYVKVPSLLPTSVLNHEQMRSLLSSIDEHSAAGYRDRTLMELLYTSGIRAGEVVALDLDVLNFEAGTAIVLGKGSKERVVPIGATALKYLRGYVAAVRPYMAKSDDEKAVFLNSKGERLSYATLRRLVKKYVELAGLPLNTSPHTFRRSCTTELLKGGAGMYHVKELLGHESLDTLKHYAKLTITDLKKTHAMCHPRERDAGEATHHFRG